MAQRSCGYSAAGHPAHPALSPALGHVAVSACFSGRRLSVLWNPKPLKWTPTGWKTCFVSPPHSGQGTGESSLPGRVTSQIWAHFTHLKS